MKKRMALFAILLGLIFTGLTVTPSLSQESSNTDTFLPISMQHYPFIPSFGVEVKTFEVVKQAADAGNYWMRYNALLWSDVQPNNNGQWQWSSELDADLKKANKEGMEVILIVRSTPTWAQRDGTFCGPIRAANLEDFALFMRQVVLRYSKPEYGVNYYEIWNEPDKPYDPVEGPKAVHGCWADQDDPYFGGAYYAEMLKAIYPEMKKANPQAQVVLGGLLLDCDPRQPGKPGYCPDNPFLYRQPKFFEGILKNGGGPFFDYVNFHGYNYYVPGTSPILTEREEPHNPKGLQLNFQAAGGQVEGKLDYLRSVMKQYDVYKPVFLSEAGLIYETEKANLTDDHADGKAEYLVYLYTRNISLGITGTTWYTLDSPGWRHSSILGWEQSKETDAYRALAVITAKLQDAFFNRMVKNQGDGVLVYEFDKGNRIWVLFSEDGDPKTINTPPNYDQAYDLYGNTETETEIETFTITDGKITFTMPIYIEFSN